MIKTNKKKQNYFNTGLKWTTVYLKKKKDLVSFWESRKDGKTKSLVGMEKPGLEGIGNTERNTLYIFWNPALQTSISSTGD